MPNEAMMSVDKTQLPSIVSKSEWEAALNDLRLKEKAATRAADLLAAERRRLPMVKVEKGYQFEGANGITDLAGLFEGRSQLVLIHFMFHPEWNEGCVGCSMAVDAIGHLSHLHARDTSLVLVSRAPYAKLKSYQQRMGWTVPWYSSFGTDFNADFDVTKDNDDIPAVSVLLREGKNVFRTYVTSGRGYERLGSPWGFLDLTPFGRQETWEDSPSGRSQTEPYSWWRRHDMYEVQEGKPNCCE